MANAKKLPSGNWRVQIFIGKNENGKNQYRSFTAPTKKQAEFLAVQYSLTNVDVTGDDRTFLQAAQTYIDIKENILSPSTISGYYVTLRNHTSFLSSKRVKDITNETIQSQINSLAKRLSPKTCRNACGFITSVLRMARPDFTIKVTLPKKQKRDIYVPDSDEIKRLYLLVKGKSIEMPFILAAECGLRASEIAALQLKNVHEEYIIIKEAQVLNKENKPVFKDPKSTSGYRKVPICEELYVLINNRASGKMVCPMKNYQISNAWSKFREKEKLDEDLVFHALRHHFASKCLLMGMPQKYIAELMGHADTRMIERVYEHIFPSAMEEFAKKLREQGKEFLKT